MYYIRKLSKSKNIERLNAVNNVDDIPADILAQELKTSDNTLSLWKYSNEHTDMDDAIKSVILSSNEVRTTILLLLDDEKLNKYSLCKDESEIGRTGYINENNLHVNIVNLTFKSIKDVLTLYKELVSNKCNYMQIEKDDVYKHIHEAYKNDKVDETKLDKKLREEISKLKEKNKI